MSASVAPLPAAAETRPESAPDAEWEAVIPPIPSLMHVEDIAPDPAFGHIAGDRASGYLGGAICPRCLTAVRFRGSYVAADQSPTGPYIELTCRAAGRGAVGEIRGVGQEWHIRWTCPACPKGHGYRQLALEVVSREPGFHAVFVQRKSAVMP